MQFHLGQVVHVPCVISPGAFTHERLVTIQERKHNDELRQIQGFVAENYISQIGNRFYIEARVRDISSERITLHLPGEYFTTAMGLVGLAPQWVEQNVRCDIHPK